MAHDGVSERPRRADSKSSIFLFLPNFCLGPGHLRGLGVSLGRILGGPSIEPFCWGVWSSQRAVSTPSPAKLKARPPPPAVPVGERVRPPAAHALPPRPSSCPIPQPVAQCMQSDLGIERARAVTCYVCLLRRYSDLKPPEVVCAPDGPCRVALGSSGVPCGVSVRNKATGRVQAPNGRHPRPSTVVAALLGAPTGPVCGRDPPPPPKGMY